jgi:hypothetical protein
MSHYLGFASAVAALGLLGSILGCNDPAGAGERSLGPAQPAPVSGGTTLDAGISDPPVQVETARGPEVSAPSSDTGSDVVDALAAPTLSYYADIKPLLSRHCVGCHNTSGIAPLSFGSYDEVSVVGAAIAHAVESRAMPPWPAARDCRSYQGDIALSDPEIARIVSWVAQGMREGAPADEPPPVTLERVKLERVDMHLKMHEAHAPAPAQGSIDEHFCFLIDWPEQETRYITGYETLPGNLKVLHHFVGFVVAPETVPLLELFDAFSPGVYGVECGAGSGLPGTGAPDPDAAATGNQPLEGVNLFAVWVPGQGPVVYPQGSGIKVVPGSKILLNMHYNVATGDASPDQTGFNFTLAKQVEREGRSMFVSDLRWQQGDNMLIPAGRDSVVHESKVALNTLINGPSRIHHAMMHMHQLGKSTHLSVIRASNQPECLLEIPRWDFDWQLNYPLAQHVDVDPGDAIQIRCEFDNSAARQPVYSGVRRQPRDVRWGENTFDEMCLGLLYVTPR